MVSREINLHPGGWAVLPSVDGEEGLAGDYSLVNRPIPSPSRTGG